MRKGRAREKPTPRDNLLLATLSQVELERLSPRLELVAMALGHVLYESERPLDHLYFPIDSIVSLLYVLESGASAEIAVR